MNTKQSILIICMLLSGNICLGMKSTNPQIKDPQIKDIQNEWLELKEIEHTVLQEWQEIKKTGKRILDTDNSIENKSIPTKRQKKTSTTTHQRPVLTANVKFNRLAYRLIEESDKSSIFSSLAQHKAHQQNKSNSWPNYQIEEKMSLPSITPKILRVLNEELPKDCPF